MKTHRCRLIVALPLLALMAVQFGCGGGGGEELRTRGRGAQPRTAGRSPATSPRPGASLHSTGRIAQDPNTLAWSLQPVTGYVYSGTCTQPDFTLIPQYGLNPNIEYTGIRSRPTQLFDVNLSKFFPITERVKFQLRLNAFNVLNHPQFGTVPYEYDTGSHRSDLWHLQ